MKILITGARGQLGHDVALELSKREIEYVASDKEDFDITDQFAVDEYISSLCPDAVIHCAAYTAVDRAEDDEENCYLVNSAATLYIARACEKIGAKLMYISTDYVFSDCGDEPIETGHRADPFSVYGKTKFEGEVAVSSILAEYFIVRTSWVYGKNGNNFVKTMLKIGREKGFAQVVCDQIGSPTYTADLSVLLCDMIMTANYGVYHATNEGFCSWADFAREIFFQAKIKATVEDVPSSEYPAKALRPKNSRLSKSCLDLYGFNRLPPWQDALGRFLKEIDEDTKTI